MNSWIPFSIRVRDARAVAMEPVREAMVLEHADGYEEYDTFEKIFDLLQQAYERKYPVRVKYNKEYGYPENMTIQPMEATDLTYWLEITRFEKAGSE
ncbi:MAG: hypothetical protein JSS81_09230 [Acidobacteria bacterium]|nr:hypothetical protein [Acidobacteriota bacterium]